MTDPNNFSNSFSSLRAESELKIQQCLAATRRVSELKQALVEAEARAAAGPSRIEQLRVSLLKITSQKEELVSKVARQLYKRGTYSRDEILAELDGVLTAETVAPLLIKRAEEMCIVQAGERVKTLRVELADAEKIAAKLNK